MWTLRDLWHLFDDEEKQRWLQQQAKRLSLGRPDTMMGLSNQIYQKEADVYNNPGYLKRPGNSAQQYEEDFYRPHKPVPYKGMI